MKIRKKIGRRVLTLALSVFMLCGMTAFPRTARADDGTRPGSIDQPLISDDAYVNLWTSDAGFSTDGGRRDYKLAVQVYVDNSLMTTYSRYHGYDKAGRTVSAWAEGKNRYTLTGMKLNGDAVQNPLALVPQEDDTLQIYLSSPRTDVTVTQQHALGGTTQSSYQLADGESTVVSLTTSSALETYGGLSVSYTPAQGTDPQLARVNSGHTQLTVTGSASISAIHVTVQYRKIDLNDTVAVSKSLAAPFNAATDSNFWLQFTVTGQQQTVAAKPLDVILVLDRSGSMAGSRMTMLKNAIIGSDKRGGSGTFLGSILPAGSQNRVAVVDYSSSSYSVPAVSSTDFEGVSGKASLLSYIDNLSAGGGTQTDSGLACAKSLLDSDSRDATKIVVLFSDGVPGNESNPSGNLNTGIVTGEAIGATRQAKAIRDAGAELYCISYISGTRQYEFTEQDSETLPSGTVPTDDGKAVRYSYKIVSETDTGGTHYYIESDDAPDLRIPVTRTWVDGRYDEYWSYQYDFYDFGSAFMQRMATPGSPQHYFDATGSIPLDRIFSTIAEQISTVATNVTITDPLDTVNCHLDLAAAGSVQWKTAGADDSAYQALGTVDTADAWYSVDPAHPDTISLHFKRVSAPGITVKFRAAPNAHVYSAPGATAANPDLLTNATATVAYTDVNGAQKVKTSDSAGANYDAGLDSPRIYIPCHVREVTQDTREFITNLPTRPVDLTALARVDNSTDTALTYTLSYYEGGALIADPAHYRPTAAGRHVITVKAAPSGAYPVPIADATLSVYIMDPQLTGEDTVFLGESDHLALRFDESSCGLTGYDFRYSWSKTAGAGGAQSIAPTGGAYTEQPAADTDYTVTVALYAAAGQQTPLTQTTLTHRVCVTRGALVLTKKIDSRYEDGSLLALNGAEQSFVFKIERRDAPGGAVLDTFCEVVSFGPNDAPDPSAGVYQKSRKVTGLRKGYYTVTEEDAWSWKYTRTGTVYTAPDGAAADSLAVGSTNADGSYFATEEKPAGVTVTDVRKSGANFLGDVAKAVNTLLTSGGC